MNSRSAQAPSQRQSPGFSKQAVRPSRVFHGLGESVWQTSPVNVRTLLIAGLLYLACLLVAVLPYPLGFARNLPSAGDPSQHLWIVRWYKTCLLEGKNPLYCNELQAPVGVPLAYFTPLLLQSLLYMPLSFICANDVIIYHILWVTGLVTTGLGTFVLASLVTRDRRAAWLGGLLAMLSGPMMMHAHGHLEMIYLGGFPLFLAAWIGFVDHPSRCGWERRSRFIFSWSRERPITSYSGWYRRSLLLSGVSPVPKNTSTGYERGCLGSLPTHSCSPFV